MAQRKQVSPPGKKVAGAKPSSKPSSKASSKPSAQRAGTTTSTAKRASGPAGRPPTRKPGRSIVNQRQTPWALIATVVVLVLFAGGIVAYAVTRNSSSSSTNPYTRPEVAAAKAIPGVIWHVEPNHTHVAGTVKYDMSPPIGGNHSAIWALCNGVTYAHPIANENAVHMLEHGAVWITYNPKTATPSDVNLLKTKYVAGVDRMAMSPYPGLKTPISLQAWNYQLFVKSAGDPRIAKFIQATHYTPNVTPEWGASCTNPYFKASQSYPGHPLG